MSVQRYKLIFILIFFIHTSTDAAEASAAGDPHAAAAVYHHHHSQQQQQQRQGGRVVGPTNLAPDNKGRTHFSPRLEYNEWHPVGRGDPLKNDPTYDYSPPVLERVRYWPENMAHKDKASDILILGVPSKKSSSQVEHQQWTNNNSPVRRNYFHQQINELPTVLMPPPLNNHLLPEETYLWTQATAHQPQRYETPADGFRYRPNPPAHPSQNFVNQYSGQKYNEPSMHHATPYQQQQQQAHSSQQYTTTIRLTTPNDFSSKKPILQTILQNEKAFPFTKTSMSTSITEYTSQFYNPQNINAMATTIIHPPQTTEYLAIEPSNTLPPVSTDIRAPHVTPAAFVPPKTSTTTTTSTPAPPSQSVSADPFLAHLQQAQPKAPLYLIIEGHSKVKTYGLNNNDTLMQLPKMVPVVGSEDPIIRHVVNRDETGDVVNIPHITMNPVMTSTMAPDGLSSSEETSEEKSAVNSLLSLLGSSFGDYFSDKDANSIDSAESDKDSKSRRNARSVDDRQQLYLGGSYQVGDQENGGISDEYDGYRRGSVFDESDSLNEEFNN